ncbi:unnamed protein product [Enterobius vermicularis]|uniref:Tudor domain-containing protein n=1 Tax=Enterobius vermicularis TaxID=51028 RepID=A0A158Q995_ENTVE|nr:unnamed protein product [Enterobius vermicularis]
MFNSHNLEKLLSRVPVKVPVNVGYVDWRNETVFCRLSDDESDYKSLLSRMNHFYSNGALRKRVLQAIKGDLYAAQIKTNWYRVELKSLSREQRECSVCLIDAGGIMVLPLINSLFVLDDRFINEPFDRSFSIQLTTPVDLCGSLKGAGFIGCSEVREGSTLDAFLLSEKEPLVALFKKENSNRRTPNLEVSPRRPAYITRIQKQQDNFSNSLPLGVLKSVFLRNTEKKCSSPRTNDVACPLLDLSPIKNVSSCSRLVPSSGSQRNVGDPANDYGSAVSVSPLSFSNTDTLSDLDSTLPQFSVSDIAFNRLDANVLNANDACQIYIETEETKRETQKLKQLLQSIDPIETARAIDSEAYCPRVSCFHACDLDELDLEDLWSVHCSGPTVVLAHGPAVSGGGDLQTSNLRRARKKVSLEWISPSWLLPGDVVLYWPFSNCPQRVRVVDKENDELTVVCIDTGEESFLEPKKSKFFRLPLQLSTVHFKPTCIGPLRLAGEWSRNWVTVRSSLKLRELCKKVTAVSFDGDDLARWVTLFDGEGRNINKMFIDLIKESPNSRNKK